MTDLSLLKLTLSKPLPGWAAQKVMCPAFRDEQIKINNFHRLEAAIGVILFHQSEELYVLFIERSEDGGPHSGQIAFPGGCKDDTDKSLLETAYREIYEEIGIEKRDLKHISELTPLFIPVSQFLVFPFVFYFPRFKEPIVNYNEISCLHVFRVKDFYNSDTKTTTNITFNDSLYEVPCFKLNEIVIWGATSMIWNECLTVLKPIVLNE